MTTRHSTGTYLDQILEHTAHELARRKTMVARSALERVARDMPAAHSLTTSLRSERVSIIAEIKRASPSKGIIAHDVVASDVAREYLAGGASAISVLTDEHFFHGSLDDLKSVAEVAHNRDVSAPVLRKDFVIDPYQIIEARGAGADAVLLIVAALNPRLLAQLLSLTEDLGMEALVEVHDEDELDIALQTGARLVGVNNRDLRTFQVDLATTERLSRFVPKQVTLVGESGIRTREDVERLGQAGVHAVLIGETLMQARDRSRAIQELIG